MRERKYQHLFFDLDHTLWDFDTNSRAALHMLYDEYQLHAKGVDDFEVFYKLYEGYNEALWDQFRKGEIKREVLRWKRFARTFLHYKIHDEAMVASISERYLELLPLQQALFPGAKEVLTYAQERGYQLHIITNGFEATQLLKIAHSGIADFFEHIITSEQAMALKPHAAIYEYALAVTGARIDNSIMIGDNYPVDIEGAINIGMDTIWYSQQAKGDERPTYHIDSLLSLKDIL